jgi:hypothetical protein
VALSEAEIALRTVCSCLGSVVRDGVVCLTRDPVGAAGAQYAGGRLATAAGRGLGPRALCVPSPHRSCGCRSLPCARR